MAPESVAEERELASGVTEGFWQWRGYRIRYQRCGDSGPAVLLVHGFGGNCDHWRKNLPVLGEQCRMFAIDLLGYGYSDKPDPRVLAPNSIYNFETWGEQLSDFIESVIREPVFLICNSVGGLAGLQAAVYQPNQVRGVQLLNISLRMLHLSKQNRFQRPFVKALQQVLRETQLGELFFAQVATSKAVKNVLSQCYGDPSTVDDELVEYILKPGLEPGAVAVFLDFISYSAGPLPEELLERVTVPVSILWGEKDPWEKLEWGREFEKYASVEEFVVLPGAGHCPQDEAPHLVNPAILRFIARHIPSPTSSFSNGAQP
ncbi:hypothetical protein WJX72_005098 [[Myrmecia] bisecta]|uniref:AB hydrolase-1 domain-containing protein n=1 Tax=[Myrmecia] bisecta TaxID=41462 RepID=A0AAW1PLG2_9CHLO